MGDAKRRGTYEERKARALARRTSVLDRLRPRDVPKDPLAAPAGLPVDILMRLARRAARGVR